MKRLAKYLSGFGTIIMLAACTVMSASADNICQKNSLKNQKEAMKYWSPERRKKVKAQVMPVLPRVARDAGLVVSRRHPSSVSESNPYPADMSKLPFKAGGRLLFVDSDGNDAHCTAEFASASNILLTAAHCVQDPKSGKWNSNFSFERAYKKGNAQIYHISEMTVRTEWHDGTSPDARFDYAFLVTEGTYESPLTISFGPVEMDLTSFGYPDNYGAGEVMYAAHGYRAAQSNGLVLMGDNPMRHGSSGGAWVVTADDNPGTLVNGLNSHRDGSISNAVWSPAFNGTTESLLLYAETSPCSGK